eukprot:6208009-Pleurochrysis_carterae.AAC.1
MPSCRVRLRPPPSTGRLVAGQGWTRGKPERFECSQMRAAVFAATPEMNSASSLVSASKVPP